MKSILISDPKIHEKNNLQAVIAKTCPELLFCESPACVEKVLEIAIHEQPVLFLINLASSSGFGASVAQELYRLGNEFIIITEEESSIVNSLKYCASAYLIWPTASEELLNAVSAAQNRIQIKEDNRKKQELIDKVIVDNSKSELIGIPTIEGFDFLHVEEIIRCEGMQKCTRIITRQRSNIISSYNLGAFRKLLTPYGFYSPHKSHLINTSYVKKYMREGTIIMSDNVPVPVSRRKKQEFLSSLTHL